MADGAPYCIYRNGELGPVDADIDLSFLTLPKLDPRQSGSLMFPGSSPWLVVERTGRFYEDRQTASPFQRLYRSRDETAFARPGDYDEPRRASVNCIPQGDGLPAAGMRDMGAFYAYTIGRNPQQCDRNSPSAWHLRKLRIDEAFRPLTDGPYIHIRATAPDFAPAPVTDATTNRDVVIFQFHGDTLSELRVDDVIPNGIDMQEMHFDTGLHRYRDAAGDTR